MRKSWSVMWAVYFACIVVVINQFKVPPVMQMLMQDLQVDMAVAGWLMSIFALAGIILAIPAAFILGKYGLKTTGLIGLGCTVLGAVIGAIAPGATVLLLGRIVEGTGMGLIAVVAPAAIAMWFKPKEMGLPMGIWSTWVPLGSTIAFNIAIPIESFFGSWRSLWWLGAALGVIAFIIYALVVTSPPKNSDSKDEEDTANKPIPYAKGFKTPGIWLLAIIFIAPMFCAMGYSTWAPSFYGEVFGIGAAKANFYTSVMFIANIFGALLCGWLLTKVKNHKGLLLMAVLISTIVFPLGFSITSESMIIPYVIAAGIVPVFIATTNFTLAPSIMPSPALAGLAMAMLTIGQNVGSLIGPPIMGNIIESTGKWTSANYPMLIIMLIALVSSIVFAKMKTPKAGNQVK